MLSKNTMRRRGWPHFAALLAFVWACSGEDGPSEEGTGGTAGSPAGAPGAAGEPMSGVGAAPSSSDAGGAGGAGNTVEGGAAGSTEGGAGGRVDEVECTRASDCAVPETNPPGCAEATCTEEGACVLAARDGDGDGFLAKRCQSLDPDIDIPTGDDCDDDDDDVSPAGWDGPAGDGHEDGCNDQLDQDCSGIIDDGVLQNQGTCTCSPNDTEPCATSATGEPIDFPVLDVDGKPVGECALGSRQCLPNGTWGECTNAKAPTPETCDQLDNDCDSLFDEDPTDPKHFYCDADNDGVLAPDAVPQIACAHTGPCGGNWLTNPAQSVFEDCDDNDGQNEPDNEEVCGDDKDNNCDDIVDGLADDDDLKSTYYRDADNDTYGTNASATLACDAPAATGWVLSGGDCVDTGAGAIDINPAELELCNGRDDDCNGDTDADDADLAGKPVTAGTTYECQSGAWKITGCPAGKLDCNGGLTCEADATSMTTCHACNASCFFQCGAESCNEVAQLAAGQDHACAVTTEGNVACWGANAIGQLGDGSTNPRNNPTPIDGLNGAALISAGFVHTCAVANPTSTLYCWGSDANGRLGSSAATGSSSSPVAVNSTTSVISVSAGGMHTCAVINNGVVRCWGLNASGQVGNLLALPAADVLVPSTVRTAAAGNLNNGVQVAAGYEHSCALLDDETVACWGDNSAFQLGKTGGDANSASVVAGLGGVSQIAAGSYHTCAVASGKVYCWGSNDNLVLGVAGAGPFSTPQEVPGLSDAVAVAAGFETTCVVRTGGSIECWGGNTSGARGDAPASASTTRTVVGISNGSQAAVGTGGFACGLRSTQDAYCWGENGSSQLGKTGADTHVPQLLVE